MLTHEHNSPRSLKQRRIDLTESEIAAMRDLCRIERRHGASHYNQSITFRLAKRRFVESQGTRGKMPVYTLTEMGRNTLIMLDSQMNGRKLIEPLARRKRPKGTLQRLYDWLGSLS